VAQSSDTSLNAGLSGLAVRNGINENLAALFSSNSGASAPSPTIGGMLWLDTSLATPILKVRNNANTAWNNVVTSDYATATGNSLITAASVSAARTVLGVNYTFSTGSYLLESGLKFFSGVVTSASPTANTLVFPVSYVTSYGFALTAEDAASHVTVTANDVTLAGLSFRHNGGGNRNVRYVAIGF
jgi:hypothetical protein